MSSSVSLFLPRRPGRKLAIAGVVRDSSGACAAWRDDRSRQRRAHRKSPWRRHRCHRPALIVDLRPGTYSVTFTLTGFATFKRDGIELTGTFTATVNADMKVGEIAETVTVAGETPVVDITSVRRQTTLTSELLTSTPTARSWAALSAQIPAMTTTGGNHPGYPGDAADGRLRRSRGTQR